MAHLKSTESEARDSRGFQIGRDGSGPTPASTVPTAAPTGIAPSTPTLTGVGIGACLAANGSTRYSSLWNVGFSTGEALLDSLIAIAGIAVFAAFVLLERPKVHERLWLVAALGVVSSVGTVALAVGGSEGWTSSLGASSFGGIALPGIASVASELSLFLLAAYASFCLAQEVLFSARAFCLGLVVAGSVQLLAAVLPSPVALVIVCPLALVSASILIALVMRINRDARWLETLSDKGRASLQVAHPARRDGGVVGVSAGAGGGIRAVGGEVGLGCGGGIGRGSEIGRVTAPFLLLNASVLMVSIMMSTIHSRWIPIQDGAAMSVAIQMCAGFGLAVTGFALSRGIRKILRKSQLDALFLLVISVALLGVYLSTLQGSLLLFSVLPLNVVYACLMLFIWVVPALAPARAPAAVSATPASTGVASVATGTARAASPGDRAKYLLGLSLFLVKRLGVLFGTALATGIAASGTGDPDEALLNVLVAVLTLVVCALYYVKSSANGGQDAPAAEGARAGKAGAGVDPLVEFGRAHWLTGREQDVLVYLAKGRTAAHISNKLDISEATVRTHIMHIYQKTGVSSQQDLMDAVEAAEEAGASETVGRGGRTGQAG